MLRCVVFDIDDTLYLERDYARSGFLAVGRHVGERYGVDDFAERAIRAFEQGSRGTIFNEVLSRLGLETTPEAIAELVDVYRRHMPSITLLPDAAECLAGLAGRVAMAVVTDGPLESQRNKATALGLARWCDPIICTAVLGADRGKPHPEAFERVERQTGARGDECVYIADNPLKDFQGPQSLGWQTVRIRRPLGLHYDRPTPSGVNDEIADLTSVANLVNPPQAPPST